jgi:hypothetical protein
LNVFRFAVAISVSHLKLGDRIAVEIFAAHVDVAILTRTIVTFVRVNHLATAVIAGVNHLTFVRTESRTHSGEKDRASSWESKKRGKYRARVNTRAFRYLLLERGVKVSGR